MRKGNGRGKIAKYGLEKDLLYMREQGFSIIKIREWILASGRMPEGESIRLENVRRWFRRRERWRVAEQEKSPEGRLDQVIALLEERLISEGSDKTSTLDSQIKGALAIGKLIELRLKLRGQGEKSEKAGEAPSLGDLLSEMEG